MPCSKVRKAYCQHPECQWFAGKGCRLLNAIMKKYSSKVPKIKEKVVPKTKKNALKKVPKIKEKVVPKTKESAVVTTVPEITEKYSPVENLSMEEFYNKNLKNFYVLKNGKGERIHLYNTVKSFPLPHDQLVYNKKIFSKLEKSIHSIFSKYIERKKEKEGDSATDKTYLSQCDLTLYDPKEDFFYTACALNNVSNTLFTIIFLKWNMIDGKPLPKKKIVMYSNEKNPSQLFVKGKELLKLIENKSSGHHIVFPNIENPLILI